MAKDDAFINALLKNGCAYKVGVLTMFDWNLGSLYFNWIYPVGLGSREQDFPLTSYNIALIRPLMTKYKEL